MLLIPCSTFKNILIEEIITIALSAIILMCMW